MIRLRPYTTRVVPRSVLIGEKKMNYDELKSKLSIDLAALHIDARNQAVFAADAGEQAAEAKVAARRARLALDESKANTAGLARNNPETFNIAKVTEAAIQAAVVAYSGVHAAELTLLDAERESLRADALANAYEHRRSMLNAEVKLWLSNYWGDVNVKDRELKAGAADVQEAKVLAGQGKHRRRKIEDDDA